MNKIFFISLILLIGKTSEAQTNLKCQTSDLNSIYYSTQKGVYKIDSVNTNPTNPILFTSKMPTTVMSGISINNNLDSVGGPTTIYLVDYASKYHYWNGTSWTATGNTSGSSGAVNMGGTSSYIFNLDGQVGTVYRYDGTSNGKALVSNLNGILVWDIATDNKGNFYLFYSANQEIVAYDFNGSPIDTFSTSGFNQGTEPGFTIVGNNFYALAADSIGKGKLYEGIVSQKHVNFRLIKRLNDTIGDIASCPSSINILSISHIKNYPILSYYPNPFSDNLNFVINDNENHILILYDVSFKKIVEQQFRNSISIATTKLLSGVYIYEIKSQNKVIDMGKILKH